MRTALLFQTHYFDRASARAFGRLRRQAPPEFEAQVLIHLPPGAPVPPALASLPHHVARSDELPVADYPSKSGGPGWDLWQGGHTDLILLHFFRAHPEYERIWVVEYDVRFSGDWGRFFTACEAIDADLLVPVLRRREDDPNWAWWGTLRPPPGEPASPAFACFMPIYRVSRQGVLAVDAAWRAGWAGHSETIWPTAIARAGLRIADPGGHGAFTPEALHGRFYSSTLQSMGLSPGSLLFKPPLYRMGSRREMLWHPVKPFWPRAELRQALRDLRAELGLLRRWLMARTWSPHGGRGAAKP